MTNPKCQGIIVSTLMNRQEWVEIISLPLFHEQFPMTINPLPLMARTILLHSQSRKHLHLSTEVKTPQEMKQQGIDMSAIKWSTHYDAVCFH